jgi:hypothetical protein
MSTSCLALVELVPMLLEMHCTIDIVERALGLARQCV